MPDFHLEDEITLKGEGQVFPHSHTAMEMVTRMWNRGVDKHPLRLHYLREILGNRGPWIECGVFRGETAIKLQNGKECHLVDTFGGLPKPQWQDGLSSTGEEYTVSHNEGHFDVDIEDVKKRLPGCVFHKGHIPEILSDLPDQRWGFVHLDLDLFHPTLACLEYFIPRSDVIVGDDVLSLNFPGVGRAWDQFDFKLLPSGQGVIASFRMFDALHEGLGSFEANTSPPENGRSPVFLRTARCHPTSTRAEQRSGVMFSRDGARVF